MTCNHVCITFQHKTCNNNINTNSNDIIWTIKRKSLFSISSWWNSSTLHHFPVIWLCTRNIQICILPEEISFFNTHIWFFSVCHSVTAPGSCEDLTFTDPIHQHVISTFSTISKEKSHILGKYVCLSSKSGKRIFIISLLSIQYLFISIFTRGFPPIFALNNTGLTAL